MKRLYIIESSANGKTCWCGIGKTTTNKFFPKFWIRSSPFDYTRFNLFEAIYYFIYLKKTHKWMAKLRIKRKPLLWWEK